VKHELTPYGGIVYDLTDKLSAYVSYTEIFLPQSERDINGQQLDPIVGESYKTGLKAEFFDGRLNASAAIFKIKQDGLGQSTGVDIPGTTTGEKAYEASEGPPARASNWRCRVKSPKAGALRRATPSLRCGMPKAMTSIPATRPNCCAPSPPTGCRAPSTS